MRQRERCGHGHGLRDRATARGRAGSEHLPPLGRHEFLHVDRQMAPLPKERQEGAVVRIQVEHADVCLVRLPKVAHLLVRDGDVVEGLGGRVQIERLAPKRERLGDAPGLRQR
eukprot:2484442-Prymnesium_polylepis.1